MRWLMIAISVLLLAGSFVAESEARTKDGRIVVACVGDSITKGYGIAPERRANHAWPAVLARLLGKEYEVVNLGSCGSTLLRGEKEAWVKRGVHERLSRMTPDVFILMLGTNDSKQRHWVHKNQFSVDFDAFINEFRQINPKARIYVCFPPPAFNPRTGKLSTGEQIAGVRIRDEVIPLLKAGAKRKRVEIIDLFSPLLSHPEYFDDGIHPNEQGAESIARLVCRHLKAGRAANEGGVRE